MQIAPTVGNQPARRGAGRRFCRCTRNRRTARWQRASILARTPGIMVPMGTGSAPDLAPHRIGRRIDISHCLSSIQSGQICQPHPAARLPVFVRTWSFNHVRGGKANNRRDIFVPVRISRP
jgi:hypothetical protein